MSVLEALPPELFEEIFSHLTNQRLLSLRVLSKQIHQRIDNGFASRSWEMSWSWFDRPATPVELQRIPRQYKIYLKGPACTKPDLQLITHAHVVALCLVCAEMKMADFRILQQNPYINKLMIWNSSASDDEINLLAKIPTLTWVNLWDTEVGPDGLLALAQSPSIKVLNVDRIGEQNSHGGDDSVERRAFQKFCETLSQNTSITSLSIGECQYIGDEQATLISRTPNLTSLLLDNTRIGDDGVRALSQSPTIRDLSLRHGKIGTKGIEALGRNPRLQSVALPLCDKEHQNDMMCFARHSQAHTLQISGLQDAGVIAISKHSYLTVLTLDECDVGEIGWMALAENSTITELRILSTACHPLGPTFLGRNKTLGKLCMIQHPMTDIALTLFFQTITIPSLVLHDVLHRVPMEKYFKAFTCLAQNQHITYLDFSYSRLGDKGVVLLSQSSSIQTLKLGMCDICNEGAIALAHNTTLTSLDLSDNGVSDDGAIALALNRTILFLDLHNNFIEDTGKEALRATSWLRELHLRGNPSRAVEKYTFCRKSTNFSM